MNKANKRCVASVLGILISSSAFAMTEDAAKDENVVKDEALSAVLGKLGNFGYHHFTDVELERDNILEIDAFDKENQEVSLYYSVANKQLVSQVNADLGQLKSLEEVVAMLEGKGYRQFVDVDLKQKHGVKSYYKVHATDAQGSEVRVRVDAMTGDVMQ